MLSNLYWHLSHWKVLITILTVLSTFKYLTDESLNSLLLVYRLGKMIKWNKNSRGSGNIRTLIEF